MLPVYVMKSIRYTVVFFALSGLAFFLIFFVYLFIFERNMLLNAGDYYVKMTFYLSTSLLDKGKDTDNIEGRLKIITDNFNIKKKWNIINIFIFKKDYKFLLEPYGTYEFFLPSCRPVEGDNKKDNCMELFIRDAEINKNKDEKKLYTGTEIKIFGDTISHEEQTVEVYTIYNSEIDGYISLIWPKSNINSLVIEWILLPILIVFTFFLVASLWIVYYLVSKTLRPLEILSRQIQRLPDYDFASGDTTEIKSYLPVEMNNEIGELARTFSFVIDELDVNIKKLIDTTAENERIESELSVAREIQLGSLPTNFPLFVEKEVEIYAYLLPAREIGGDLYDFFVIDDEHICFTVGDVAGKGVPAALFMVIAKKIIGSNSIKGQDKLSPGKIMDYLNEILCKENPSATFITLFIGILNVKTGSMCYANGGHVPPIFSNFSGETSAFYRKEISGPVVGVIPGIRYKDITEPLHPGGTVFLCTDGVTEAMNKEEELFGDQQLLENFMCMKEKSCKEVVEGILYEVRKHADGEPQSDDIAMMMIRWRGAVDRLG